MAMELVNSLAEKATSKASQIGTGIDKLELRQQSSEENKIMSKQNHTGMFLSGLTIGGAVGTILGLLVAPRTGKETRKVLKKSADALPELAEDLASTVQMQADRLSESALENWESTLIRLREAIAAGIEASRETSKMNQTPPVSDDVSSSLAERN